jgi:regulator of protease activity HflC (stomatin/prohibitin superfamily)
MSGALDWIGHIFEWIGSFIPRILHIKSTHRGVMFTRDKVKEIGPGLHVYLPFWANPDTYPVKRQTINLPAQVLTTADKKSVVIDVAVIYEVDDILKALVDTFNLEDTIRDTAQGAVKRVVIGETFDDLQRKQTIVDKLLTKKVRAFLRPYGIKVIKAFVISYSQVRVFRLIQDQNDFKMTPPNAT